MPKFQVTIYVVDRGIYSGNGRTMPQAYSRAMNDSGSFAHHVKLAPLADELFRDVRKSIAGSLSTKRVGLQDAFKRITVEIERL